MSSTRFRAMSCVRRAREKIAGFGVFAENAA